MGSRHKPRALAAEHLVDRFAGRVRARFPACPPGEARRIARYACAHGTERVGVLAGPDGYLDHAVELAVVAHVRHRFTRYERLLDAGLDRDAARAAVLAEVLACMARWGLYPPGRRSVAMNS
ncbi:MAG: hypothetical protein JWM10_3628 [Myxococcaceae bacterium]|nr:hypothetical protein [Myxococcaceae bacterium]